ncbi:hypothetical protein TNCV_4660731 [Trichonephila clavipes]|uniref:Uncharacterized protein n=1 Tax=Trichonephila clavipes TaxID=2585209 RepID=A0A8X6SAX0_TRICX|nr:hypothetical protein TNCV_4660731 [Trichonephila clavipes]
MDTFLDHTILFFEKNITQSEALNDLTLLYIPWLSKNNSLTFFKNHLCLAPKDSAFLPAGFTVFASEKESEIIGKGPGVLTPLICVVRE